MDYAIIKLGNKQHRVRDGETLVVDRLPTDEGKTFEPVVLLGDLPVTATILSHERGPKILIGKYRRRTGYKRHNGFRAATSRVEITLGAGGTKKAAAKAPRETKTEHVEEAALAEEAFATTAVEASEAETPEAEKAETEKPETEKAEKPETEKATGPEHPGVEAPLAKAPEGYEGMTIAQVTAAAKEWSVAELEAALAHEVETSARKGAITALEAALKRAEEPDGA